MKIIVEAAGWLKRFTSGRSELELDLPENASAIKAAATAGIPESETGFLIVNGKKVDGAYVLKDGDTVKVYSHIIGG